MKIIVSAAMLFLLLISMSTTAFNIQPVKTESKTIVVPYDYPTIQQAINAAGTEDTIYVRSGTYQECIVVNKTVAIVGENKENTIIQENYYASIDASESVVNIVNDGVSIINFTIRNGLYGIRLNSSNNIINGNNVTDNRYGIYLDFSSNNTIYENSIGDHFVWGPSSYGIYLHESLNNNIRGNTFYHSSYCIYLDQSFDNNIFRNDVSSSWTGIYISSSSNNSLYENTIVNQPYGVQISRSSNNRIFANNLTSNDFGIWIENSLDNVFYRNSIVNSRLDQVETDLSANVWDDGYPSGGNYWSDYTGDDEKRGPRQDEFGCDGIGDTPYEIDAKNRDRYPLMNHWIPPTPPLKFVVVPAEGWQNKELFVPVWGHSVEDPGKIVLGIYNKRNMWYLVKVYKKMPDGTWLEIVPDEFLSEGPYVGPWNEKKFLYAPQAGDEIKIEVLNDKTDFGLMSLWTLDFVMRTLVGLRLPAKLPEYTDWNVFKEHLKDFYNAVIKPILSDIRSGLWKKVLKEVCQAVLEIRGAFSAIVVGLGFDASLEDKIWAKIGEMAGGLLRIFSIVVNVVSTRAWELFENLFKSPFSEDVTLMIASKAPAVPKVEVSSGLAIIQSEPYYVGETINARFRITNKGSETMTLHVLTVGGRGPEGDVQDFTFKTNIVINPGEAYDYEGELTLLNSGSYHFFVAYQTVDGVWVTNVPASAGAVNSLDINVLSPNSWVAAELCSPGELRIYDSQDRVTGLVNNEELRGIPHSFYFEGIVVIYDPNDSYKYQVKGTNEGEYNITLARCIFENLTVFEAEQIPISNNSLHQYTCNWDTLSLNAEGVIVQVDSEGDGFFEKTFASGSKLTYKEFMFPAKATFTFNAFWEGFNYPVIVSSSNSTIADFNFYQSLKQISFKVSGETGTSGYCNVTIPKNLLKGEPWTVRLNGTDWTFTPTQNETHSCIYFTYTHSSTYEVTIQGTWVIPEFPSTLILAIFMLTTLITTIILKTKRKRQYL